MTEIRVDVDLEHPPSAVWRALTEAHLVTDWLPTTRFMVRDDGTFTFQATALAGLEDPIEGEVVTTETAHRLVMRWSGENLHTVVALTLDELPGGGTRFTMTQSGFLGPQGTMRRRVLRRTYQQLFEGPLTATLAKHALPPAPSALAAPSAPSAAVATDSPAAVRRNDGGPFNRLPRQLSGPSRSAPGLSSHTRSTAGPRPTTTMPGFAAAVLGARATGVAAVPVGGDTATTAAPLAVAAPAATSPATTSLAAVAPSAPSHRSTRPSGIAAYVRRLGSLGTSAANAIVARVRRVAAARDWSADRRSQAMAAAAAILLLLAMIALLVGKATAPHPAKPPRTGGGLEGPVQATFPGTPAERSSRPALVSASSAAATAPPSSPGAPSVVAAASGPQLIAGSRTEDLTLTSYRVTVTITNPGPGASTGWTVAVVLPLLDLTVRNVDGAVMTRTGLKVIFTPVDSTRTIAAGGTATLRFEVQGLGVRNAPLNCTIDGRPCTQVSG
ncbi:SRPBCC domain-containing protein [Dactylosporangium sp. NPDC000521]|uniref:SRPBCC domain-containing protein n=1 Tax=Dactylosporangium sp. NPDC000521 TaxID=3363975 RepID=UPI0036BB6B61